MIKVRILPLLKRLGFKQQKDNPMLYKREDGGEAKVYKIDDRTRAIDITFLTVEGQRQFLLHRFPLDVSSDLYGEDQESYYSSFFLDLAIRYGNMRILENIPYYLYRSNERKVDDGIVE